MVGKLERVDLVLPDKLKGLFPIMMGWPPDGWLVEDVMKKETDQMSLF